MEIVQTNDVEDIFGLVKTEQEKAILLACKEIIREANQGLTVAAYFGVLYRTVLECVEGVKAFGEVNVVKGKDGEEKAVLRPEEERCRGAVRLLSLVTKELPQPTLKRVFPDTAKLLVTFFKKKPSAPLALPALKVIHPLLTLTNNPITDPLPSKLLRIILDQSIIGKPKVRKTSIETLSDVFSLQTESTPHLITALQAALVPHIKNFKQDTALNTLHGLFLLQSICKFLPLPNLKHFVEVSLRLPSMGHGLVTVCTFNFFAASFSALTNKWDTKKQDEDEVGFCAALLNAIFDTKPNMIDKDVVISYVNALVAGYIALAKSQTGVAVKKLPSLVKELLPIFQGGIPNVCQRTAAGLSRAFEGCITTQMIEETVDAIQAKKDQATLEKLPYIQLVLSVRPGLNYSYQAAWEHILSAIQSLFTVTQSKLPIGKEETSKTSLSLILSDILRGISYLREGAWISPVEHTLASALSLVGIKPFLETIPLRVPSVDYPTTSENNTNKDNLWLLPFLKKNLSHSHLAYFVIKFLPIIEALEKNIKNATEKGTLVEAQILSTLYKQIWELFPAFCNLPSDIPASFKKIAKLLGTALKEKPSLRKIVAAGLWLLIKKNKDSEDEKNRENLTHLATYSKNYLPVFFSLLSDESVSQQDRGVLLQTAEMFISISEKGVVDSFFNNLVGKLIVATTKGTQEEDQGQPRTTLSVASLTEIATLFVPVLELQNVELVYRTIRPQLGAQDLHLQKKSMKALLVVCLSHRVFVGSHFVDLMKILEETEPKKNNNSVKKFRMKLIKVMVEEKKLLDKETRLNILPEVIANTKEVNSSVRQTSCSILEILGKIFDEASRIKELISDMSAGLALQPPFVAATLECLSTLLKKHHRSLDDNFKREILTTVVLFLRSPHREVVQGAMTFIRRVVPIYTLDDLKPFLASFFGGIGEWDEGMQGKLHNELKLVLEKMIKKLGYVNVVPAAGEKWASLLKNVKKSMKRAQKKKEEKRNEKFNDTEKHTEKHTKKKTKDKVNKAADSEEDSESSDDSMDGLFEKHLSQKQGTWVLEGRTDDEIIDFLESSAVQHVVSHDPGKVKKKKNGGLPFKMSEEGKLIIDDFEAQEEAEKVKRGKEEEVDEELEEEVKKHDRNLKLKQQSLLRRKLERERRAKMKAGQSAHSATRYKAKKAGGDVMKKDAKFEPYAYVPLDPKQLNKRRRFSSHKKYSPLLTTTSMKGRAIQKRKSKK